MKMNLYFTIPSVPLILTKLTTAISKFSYSTASCLEQIAYLLKHLSEQVQLFPLSLIKKFRFPHISLACWNRATVVSKHGKYASTTASFFTFLYLLHLQAL